MYPNGRPLEEEEKEEEEDFTMFLYLVLRLLTNSEYQENY
jgi:hypothetical protein